MHTNSLNFANTSATAAAAAVTINVDRYMCLLSGGWKKEGEA